MSQVKRPLSPHLTIYRPQITSVLSITHRMTGLALVAGSFLVVYWLWVAAYDPSAYEKFHECLGSVLGRIALLGWTLAFYYHLCNGIRHLFWDIGKGFSIPAVTRSGIAVVISAVLLTAFTWGVALSSAGVQ